jgi:hypothetical protein
MALRILNLALLCLAAVAGLIDNKLTEADRGEPVLLPYGLGLLALYGIAIAVLPVWPNRWLSAGVSILTLLVGLVGLFLISAQLD